MAEKSDYILELLLEYGLISQDQADEGWAKVGESEGTLDILDALKEMGPVPKQTQPAVPQKMPWDEQ